MDARAVRKVVDEVELATTLPDATTCAGGAWCASTSRRPAWWCTTRSALPPGSSRWPAYAEHVGRGGGHRVVDEVEAGLVEGAERVRGEEGDLDHVVPAERVVGVLDVVLAERDREPHRGQLTDRQVQRPGVRVGDEAEPRAAGQAGQPFQGGPGVQPERAGVVGDAAADQPVPDQRGGQQLGGAERGVAGVVDEHRHPPVARGGELAHPADVLAGVVLGVLDPGDAADHVRAEVDRLLDQLLGARVAQQAVLRERHHLQVHDAAELLAQRQQRDHALEPCLGVDVGEGQHVPDAVPDGLEHRAPGVRLDPGAVVVRLDRGGELDRRERGGHVAGGVRRRVRRRRCRSSVYTLSRCRWPLTKLSVTSAPAASTSSRPDDRVSGDHGDPVAVDADPPATFPTAQGRVGDDQVVVGHCRLMSGAGPSWSTTRSKVPRSRMFLAR